MNLNRREFLEAAAVAAVASTAVAGEPTGIPLRPFGKTGLNVSMLGFGSGSRFRVIAAPVASHSKSRRLIRHLIR